MSGIAAAIISGVAAIGSAVAQGVTAKKQAERANQFAIEQRDYQNAYNTPESQMQRFVEAGLNPNLLYGQVKNHASEGADYQTAKYDNMFNQLSAVLPTLLGSYEQIQDIKLKEEETKQKELSNQFRQIELNTIADKFAEELNLLRKNNTYRQKEIDSYDDIKERERLLNESTIKYQGKLTEYYEQLRLRQEQDYEYYNNPTQKVSRNLGGVETLIINFMSEFLPYLKSKLDNFDVEIKDLNPFSD